MNEDIASRKDIAFHVGISGDKVARDRPEGHEASVGANCRRAAAVIGLPAVTGDADPRGDACQTVVNEDVLLAVGISYYEIVAAEVNATTRPSALRTAPKLPASA
jgi:hypothetical protein